MADQRIKGQEVEVLIVAKGVPLTTISDIRSFEVTAKLDKKEEGYLGEKTNRYDEIFNGLDGRMDLHIENQDIFNLMVTVIDRARRREPGAKINIKATLNFPNGQRPRVLMNDVFFGNIPLSVGGRGDYGAVSLDFSCSDLNVLS